MHATQKTYATARALHEVASAACLAEKRAANITYSDETFDRDCDLSNEIDERHGVDGLRDALRIAEDAMIDWSTAQSRPLATAKQWTEIEAAIAKGRVSPKFRPRLVDIAFRLAGAVS